MAMAGVSSSCLSSASSSSSSSSSFPLRQASLRPPVARFRVCSLMEKTALPDFTFGGVSSQFFFSHKDECNHIVTHAVAEVLTSEPTVEVEEKAPSDEVSKLKLESDLLKKKAKRAELRRKRLVRKRHLRKKGRWPPSKMAKLKNV